MYFPTFATSWIADWNSHDLERTLTHYESITINSPYAKLYSEGGNIKGKAGLRAYWLEALRRRPNLHLEAIETFAGFNSGTLVYREETGKRIAESFVFDEGGLIAVTSACVSIGLPKA